MWIVSSRTRGYSAEQKVRADVDPALKWWCSPQQEELRGPVDEEEGGKKAVEDGKSPDAAVPAVSLAVSLDDAVSLAVSPAVSPPPPPPPALVAADTAAKRKVAIAITITKPTFGGYLDGAVSLFAYTTVSPL